MITYIELWKAKQAWLDLSTEDRANYMTALGPAIQGLLEGGATIISWGVNDTSTYNRADYDFFGVWTFPSVESAHQFEQMVEGAGWYNYFDQVNAMGSTSAPPEVIGRMIEM
jgi:hypothetical protein